MTESEYIACVYHELFNYTLSKAELYRWRAGKKVYFNKNFSSKNSFQKLQAPQNRHKKSSIKKLVIAKKAATILRPLPFILFVGISGSLAMNNAHENSDVDFLIITKKNTLWISRVLSILLLVSHQTKLRRAGNRNEKDKICLNMWLDEAALDLPSMPHNMYTAHEVSQVIPLVNKNNTYEKWLQKNKWVRGYWPHAVNTTFVRLTTPPSNILYTILNLIFFLLQKIYMSGKITREQVSVHYAYFHPFDWGEKVMKELEKKGVVERVK